MRRLLSHGLHDGDCPAIFQDIKSVCLSKSHEEKKAGWCFQAWLL
jgi:hypothetical protein